MKRRVLYVLGVAMLAAVAAWLVLKSRPGNRALKGAALAQAYCRSCHLLPDASLLDKASWTNGALPDMARWLGLEPPILERLPDGSVAPESNVFPTTPLITRSDWNEIVQYYADAAPAQIPEPTPRPVIEPETKQFRVKDLPYRRQLPMTLMVHIDPAAKRLYVGDALTHTLEALDPLGQRIFAVEFDSGPISITPRGDYVDLTTVGRLFPSDLTKGKLLRLRPGADRMNIDRMMANLRRPVHTIGADLNRDGREDFVVCQFGNRRGRLSWFAARSGGGFDEHVLLDRPGAIRTEVADLDGDGLEDIVALMGQAWEGVYLFTQTEPGRFRERVILQQHPVFGYSHLALVDFDRDGDLDLLTTNGDNGESAAPPKPYHGIRLYLNDGKAGFSERWFFPLHGAYQARAMDFDLDGDTDVAAISYFPDYSKTPEESFVYIENLGDFRFKAASIQRHAAGRWMSMDAGDLDGDGDGDIVIGSLVLGPPSLPIPAEIQRKWQENAPAVLLLENVAR
ncbi:MAG: VCBS repeat-containing protein [Verrucomicrobia subdivision 3 bacterium]|nr:VCBS repeat-containing protein [Limisphaerales bacterium]